MSGGVLTLAYTTTTTIHIIRQRFRNLKFQINCSLKSTEVKNVKFIFFGKHLSTPLSVTVVYPTLLVRLRMYTSLHRCWTSTFVPCATVEQDFCWTRIRFPVVRGFSVLIRNSFWTACYYLWPLDVWIDLQALGPGHCVVHVWRRSWPLCVRQGPQISCPPSPPNTHTKYISPPCPTHYLNPLNKSLQNTLMFCRILGITEQTCAFSRSRCKKMLHNFHHRLSVNILSTEKPVSLQTQCQSNDKQLYTGTQN